MENTEHVTNTDSASVDVGIENKTLTFPVRVKIAAPTEDSLNCELIMSIDDLGQILVTPQDPACEFISATTEWEVDNYATETTSAITQTDNTFVKEFTLVLTANILKETSRDNIYADIDTIGQCVIYPEEGNSFVSVTTGDSLNLVTEEVQDSDPEDESVVPDLEGKIVEDTSEDTPYSFEEVFDELSTITHNFTEEQGAVKCAFESEMIAGVKILESHYSFVKSTQEDTWYYIEYAKDQKLVESLEYSHEEIVDRFLRSELSIFSDDKIPENCEHISELDSDGFQYYYDPESDSIVVVHVEVE